MRSRYWMALLVLGPATACAWGDDCKFRADRAAGVDAKGVEKVVIRAGAGDLKVVGRSNAVRIEARGVACAGKQAAARRHADQSCAAKGTWCTSRPRCRRTTTGWSLGQQHYAYIDIGIALPANMPVEAIDSSGDAVFEDLKSLDLQDSSGDLRSAQDRRCRSTSPTARAISTIERRRQRAGERQLRATSRSTTCAATSTCRSDSSGDMRITKVDGNVTIEQDSSGGIRVEDVQGQRHGGRRQLGRHLRRARGRRLHRERGQLGQHRARGDRRQDHRAVESATTTDSSGVPRAAAAAAPGVRPAGAASDRSCGGRRTR